MLNQLPKVLLLVALLAAFAASSIPAFGKSRTCVCIDKKRALGGCRFDEKTSQCISIDCKFGCLQL